MFIRFVNLVFTLRKSTDFPLSTVLEQTSSGQRAVRKAPRWCLPNGTSFVVVFALQDADCLSPLLPSIPVTEEKASYCLVIRALWGALQNRLKRGRVKALSAKEGGRSGLWYVMQRNLAVDARRGTVQSLFKMRNGGETKRGQECASCRPSSPPVGRLLAACLLFLPPLFPL